jgi:hypothetical protein
MILPFGLSLGLSFDLTGKSVLPVRVCYIAIAAMPVSASEELLQLELSSGRETR